MSAVIWLNEDDLIFMRVVQRALLILLDRRMEDGLASLHLRDEVRVLAIVGSDDVRAAEAVLRGAPPWDKYGAIVNGHREHLLLLLGMICSPVPQRGREDGVAEQLGVLGE